MTEQQKVFAKAYADTGLSGHSARVAGYAHPDTNAHKVLAQPLVQQTVRQIQERRILNDLMPKALNLLEKAITDETWKPEVRIRAAAEVRQWYGQITGDGLKDKAPEDMTPGELNDRIAALRARQAQLADGARIIEGEAIEDAQEGDVFG